MGLNPYMSMAADMADFCRTLERENVALAAERDALKAALEGLMWRFERDDSDPHEATERAPDILAAQRVLVPT